MQRLVALLESLPDDEPWHICFDYGHEYILSNFAQVDSSIYDNETTVIADVIKNISGSKAITPKNKIEFDVTSISCVKSVDGTNVLFP